MLSDRRSNKVVSKGLLKFMFLQTLQWVSEDMTINTGPVFPAGDPFLTSKHQRKKTHPIPSFPVIHSPPWWCLVHRRETFFYSAHEQTGDKQALGMTGGRGRALGWEERVVAGFLPTTSLPSGRGMPRMREDMVCPGRRKAEFHPAVLLS